MSLLSEFNRFFKKALAPYNFKKLKGMHCFGRLVNDEIFHYVTYRNTNPIEKNAKAFSVLVGIETVYSKSLAKDYLQDNALDCSSVQLIDSSFHKKPAWNIFYYNDSNVADVVKSAFEETSDLIFRYFECVHDLSEYVDFCKCINLFRLSHADKFHSDSILLIKTSNHDSFLDVYEKKLQSILASSQFTGADDPLFIHYKQNLYEDILDGIVRPRDRVYQNPELMCQAKKIIEQRRNNNIITLASYGLTLPGEDTP